MKTAHVPVCVHPQTRSTTAPTTNKCIGAQSSPAAPLPAGQVALMTLYGWWFPISVVDQFGQPLDPMYNSVGVTEGGNTPINQVVTNGVYLDAVTIRSDYVIVDQASDAAKNWPSQPVRAPASAHDSTVQNVKVQVGGFLLDNFHGYSIMGRVVKWSTPDSTKPTVVNIEVDWTE